MSDQLQIWDSETSRTRLVGPYSRTEIVRYGGASGDFRSTATARLPLWPAAIIGS